MNPLPHVIVFEGRVLPEVRNVTLPGSHSVRYTEPTGFDGEFKVGIRDSHVRVECQLSSITDRDIQNAAARAAGFASSVVDVVAFSTGWALQVILDSIAIGDEVKPFAVSEKRVAPLCTAYSLESGFDEVCDWALTDFTLRFTA